MRSSDRVGILRPARSSAPIAWKAARGECSTSDQIPQHSGVATPGSASATLSVLHDARGSELAWSTLGASLVMPMSHDRLLLRQPAAAQLALEAPVPEHLLVGVM